MINQKRQAYDTEFYNDQVSGSYNSAKIITKHLYGFYAPKTVIDIGCGRGTWLKAFKDLGATDLKGLDGPWNSQADMTDPQINFEVADLNQPERSSQSKVYDLAISLEVAEHLKPESSEPFVKFLTSLSDVVLFSSAFISQGGTEHINERTHTFWANLFILQGFKPYDLFRPVIWGNPEVEFWYQQNCFLYVKNGSYIEKNFSEKGITPIANLDFMNCVHPTIYKRHAAPSRLHRVKNFIFRVKPRNLGD